MAWLDSKNSAARRDLDGELRRACAHLRRRDPVLAGLIRRQGPCRLESTTNYFQVMLETVISQQLSIRAAQTIYDRLARALGGRGPRPADVLRASDDVLRGAGLSRSKATYVRNVAEAFATRRLGPASLARLSDEEVVERLTRIKGVGEWSAHMFLIFALNRLDVFPLGDLGLRNAIVARYALRRNVAPRRLERIGDAWRPYRTVGTMVLWASYDGGPGATP